MTTPTQTLNWPNQSTKSGKVRATRGRVGCTKIPCSRPWWQFCWSASGAPSPEACFYGGFVYSAVAGDPLFDFGVSITTCSGYIIINKRIRPIGFENPLGLGLYADQGRPKLALRGSYVHTFLGRSVRRKTISIGRSSGGLRNNEMIIVFIGRR